jgi:hypothetical protein
MRRIPIICLVVLLVATGCSTLKDQYDKFFGAEDSVSAQELAWDGMDAYENGKYEKAIEKFQKLKDYYPFSKYAILAELKIADAHYQRQEYEDRNMRKPYFPMKILNSSTRVTRRSPTSYTRSADVITTKSIHLTEIRHRPKKRWKRFNA